MRASGERRRREKGRKLSGRFAMQPEVVLDHDAVKTLTHAAFRVFILLTKQCNGHNNGAIGLSKIQAAHHGISNKTLYKALHELEFRGLIEEAYPASRVPPRPTMYALTFRPRNNTRYSDATRTPSNAYQDYQPTPKTSLKLVTIGGKRATK